MNTFPARTEFSRKSGQMLVVLAAAIALALTACGGNSGASAESNGTPADDFGLGQDVLAKAKDEGTVNYAGSTLSPDISKKMQKILKDEYGIKLTVTPLKAAQALERLRSEARAGNRVLDTVGLGVQYGEVMKKEGLSEPFKPTGFPDFMSPATEFDAEGYWYPFQVGLYGVAVNKKLLDPSKVTSWKSLSDGSVDKSLVMADPSVGSGGFTWAVAMEGEPGYGDSYLTTLGDRPNLQMGPVHADNVARLARGDVAAYFPFSAYSLHEIQGSAKNDIELVYPGNTPYIAPINLSLVKQAPHPNAARVWVSFLMSDAGQKLVAEGGQTPVRKGVTVPDPKFDLAKYPEVVETRLADVIAKQDQVESFSQQFFGK